MATAQIPILGAHSNLDGTGRCFFEPYVIKATNDIFNQLALIFNDPTSGQTHGIYGVFTIPQNWASASTIVIVWTSTATSGNCRWQFQYRAIGGNDSESLDQTTFQEAVPVTDAAPTSVNLRLTASISLTDGNLAIGDTVEFYFSRYDDSGTDTMAAAASVHSLLFQYTTT